MGIPEIIAALDAKIASLGVVTDRAARARSRYILVRNVLADVLKARLDGDPETEFKPNATQLQAVSDSADVLVGEAKAELATVT